MSSSMADHSSKLIEKVETQANHPRGLQQGQIPFRPNFVPMNSIPPSYVASDRYPGTQMGGGTQQVSMEGTAGAFGLSQYSAEQIASLQARLSRKLGPEYIAQRPGPGGGPKLSYVEGWKILSLANEVFGFNGWSSSIMSLTVDFCDMDAQGRVNVGVTSIVRVTLRDGAFHEDIGYGEALNLKSRSGALDKAKKEATTDGLKRALRNFGNVLGLCLYDKDYTKEVVKIKVRPVPFKPDELWRRPEFDESLQASTSAGPSRPHPLTADAYNTMPTPGGGRSGMAPPRTPGDMAPPPVPCTPLRSIDDADMDDFDDSFFDESNTTFDSIDMPPPPLPIAKQEPAISHQKAQTPQRPSGQGYSHHQQSLPPPVTTVSRQTSPPIAPSLTTETVPQPRLTRPVAALTSANPVVTACGTPSSSVEKPPPPERLGGFIRPVETKSKAEGSAARKRAIEQAKLDRDGLQRTPLGETDPNKRQRV